MRHPASRLSLLAALLFGLTTAAPQRAAAQDETLTNESVVQMVQGKVPKDLILTKIRSTRSAFDVSAGALVRLQQSKVDREYVKAMIVAAANGTPKAAPETLTNEQVISMVSGQVARDVVLLKIQNSRAAFDLTANGLVSLNQSKVPQEVVKAMMAAPTGPATVAATPQTPPKAEPAPAPAASAKPSAGATFTDKDFEKVIITRNAADVKGLKKVGDVSAQVRTANVTQSRLRDSATVILKHETAKKGATHVFIMADNFSATPQNTVTLKGTAYK